VCAASAAQSSTKRTARLPSFNSTGQPDGLDSQLLGLEVDADALVADLDTAVAPPSVKEQVAYTFLVAVPPFLIAVLAHNVQIVRTITGAYPGLAVMMFIPSGLVYVAGSGVMLSCVLTRSVLVACRWFARKALQQRVVESANTTSDLLSPSFRRDVAANTSVFNPQASPFKSNLWIYAIVLIGAVSAVYDTVDLFL